MKSHEPALAGAGEEMLQADINETAPTVNYVKQLPVIRDRCINSQLKD